jgi:receptor protein-tyrosine kinase
MDEGLTAGRQAFDMVLIDTPPVLPVADAIIMGTQADGVVLCARAGELQRDDAIACRERLKYEKIKILGTILNRYRARPSRYSKRGKYYGTYEEPAPVEESHAA